LSQNAMGQIRLSSETLGKLTSESTLVTPEIKAAKTVRGSMLVNKGKSESHGSGSQKQHHQHSSETPQVQTRAPWKEGWDPSSSSSLSLASCSLVSTTSFLQVPLPGKPECCPWTTPERGVHPAGVRQMPSVL